MCTHPRPTQPNVSDQIRGSGVWVCVRHSAHCSFCVSTRLFKATSLLSFCLYSQSSSVFWLASWYMGNGSLFFLISGGSDLTNSVFPAVGGLAGSWRRWEPAAQASRSYDELVCERLFTLRPWCIQAFTQYYVMCCTYSLLYLINILICQNSYFLSLDKQTKIGLDLNFLLLLIFDILILNLYRFQVTIQFI